MKEPQYKHFFTVENGKFIWEEEDMFNLAKKRMEGKKGFVIIEEVEDNITPNQFAYYFGGIIRSECMNSNAFAGMTEKEVHQVLFSELRSYTKTIEYSNGKVERKVLTEDFSNYRKKEMIKYLEELIPHLQVNYNIHPKPSSHYKYNQFLIRKKTMSHVQDNKSE